MPQPHESSGRAGDRRFRVCGAGGVDILRCGMVAVDAAAWGLGKDIAVTPPRWVTANEVLTPERVPSKPSQRDRREGGQTDCPP